MESAMRASAGLEGVVRIVEGAPHVGDRAAVKPEALLWLLEVPADDIEEGIDRDLDARLERVQIVHRDQARVHVPLVLARVLVVRPDVNQSDSLRALPAPRRRRQ